MENHLRNSERSELSTLMITGVWLESLYLATQVASSHDNEDLRLLIGEQKLILNDLLLVLNFYNDEASLKNYISDLDKIMSLYDEVEIVSAVGDPEAVEKDGMLEMVQSETIQLKMSDEVLDRITVTTAEVRNAHLRSADLSSAGVTLKTQEK